MGADLMEADLLGWDLSEADLLEADLVKINHLPGYPASQTPNTLKSPSNHPYQIPFHILPTLFALQTPLTMPALHLNTSTSSHHHANPQNPPSPIHPTEQASNLQSLTLSTITLFLAIATLLLAYLHFRLQARALNGTATPPLIEDDEPRGGEGSITLDGISESPGK